MAVNEKNKTAVFAEVKMDKAKLRKATWEQKSQKLLNRDLKGYKPVYHLLSLENMKQDSAEY